MHICNNVSKLVVSLSSLRLQRRQHIESYVLTFIEEDFILLRRHRVFVKDAYISRAYAPISVFKPLGWIVWSMQIHRSSRITLSAAVCKPDSKITISISVLMSCSVEKCCASSELSGRFLMSYLCLEKRLHNFSPVCPT